MMRNMNQAKKTLSQNGFFGNAEVRIRNSGILIPSADFHFRAGLFGLT